MQHEAKKKIYSYKDDKRYVINNNNNENELQKLKENLIKLAIKNNTINEINNAIRLLEEKSM